MRLLRQCNEQLESMQKGTDIDVQLERLSTYCMQNLVDFDKYTALSTAESLASDAKQHSHPKASFLYMASQIMRGYLNKDPKQFRAYFLALFAEKEYTQVPDRISKVDKSLRGDRTSSQFPPGRSQIQCYCMRFLRYSRLHFASVLLPYVPPACRQWSLFPLS